METIIVEIQIAVTGCVLDFALPAHVPVRSLIDDMIALVEQTMPHIEMDREMPLLYDGEKGIAIPMNMTLAQAGMHDSSRLILA